MNILIYRMFFHAPFVSALKKSEKNITFFSSERRMDETGVINSYYESDIEANISNELICDIVTRCRYLSGINFFDARLKVRKMWASVEGYYDNFKVDLVLSPAVDNYVTDIWFKVASSKGVPAFQPRRSPLPGLVRITNSIDNPVLRQPSNDDITSALEHLSKNFKADYQNIKIRSTRQIAMRATKEIVKKIGFEYWKNKYSDPDSFHYNAIFPNKNSITIKSLSQLWFYKRFKATIFEVENLKSKFEKIIFWPLAMAPESALCYLNADSSFSDYKDVISKVVDHLPENILLVVKEHPSAIGYRSVEHYSKLLSKNNVVVCNSSEMTGRLIQLADAILVNTSSTTGLEAVAVGKPVLAMGSCHYNVPGIVDEISSLGDMGFWCQKIRTTPLTLEESRAVIYKYLSNTFGGATWSLAGQEDKNYAEKIHCTLSRCIDLVNSGYIPKYHGL